MSTRGLLCCATTSLLLCACSVPRPRAPSRAPQARDYEAVIARLERNAPESPAGLNAKLAYAQFLLDQTQGPCAKRLNLAQEELGSVAVDLRTRVLYPEGWALLAVLEYHQHLGRAACGSPSDRRDELLAAVEAARRAVERYRDRLDYRSMVIMQFDTAIALRRLGENAAALAALERALGMDRQYGFREDARENDELLLTWQGESAGAAKLAKLMREFPKRRAVLKFRWHSGDARITLERRRAFLEDGRIVRSRAAAAFERRIEADPGGGWSVSYAHRLARYEPGVWPLTQPPHTAPAVFAPALFPAVDFKVNATGEFEGATDSKAFATRLIAKTEQLIRAGAPSGDQAPSAIRDAIETTEDTLLPGVLEAETAENYRLETAMWSGATLEQGVSYETSAPLALPGIPRLVVENRIEFVFTRRVPCTAGAAVKKCIEIVVHATPEEDALGAVMADIASDVPLVDFEASTEARFVIDPATLLPYAREEWIDWYASEGEGKGDSILESEHVLSSTSYARESGHPHRYLRLLEGSRRRGVRPKRSGGA